MKDIACKKCSWKDKCEKRRNKMGITISFILFIIMSCYTLYINYSWHKYCEKINNEWAKKCCEINKEWADYYNSIIKEKENES